MLVAWTRRWTWSHVGGAFAAAVLALVTADTDPGQSKALVYDSLVQDLAERTWPSETAGGNGQVQADQDQDVNNDVDINALLASMTLQEKIAQMTQLDIYSMMNGDCRDPKKALNEKVTIEYAKQGIGSILNAPFPGPIDGRTGWNASEWRTITDQIKAIYREHSKTPMIYGIDTIHGATYVRGATLFGQPLSAASSFNPELVFKMGEIEAKDTLAAGIPWVFSPVLGIAVQPKWSRVYETFGEDPYVASQMGASIIKGIQQSGKVAACMKHFIGYSNPIDGLDRADNVITDWDLLNYYAPSFLAATEAGVKTAMETYISINGYPVIASHKILTDLLRTDMKFDGMLVSDYAEIDRMFYEHHSVPDVATAVRVSLNLTSLDMNMGPKAQDFFSTVEKLVSDGLVQETRLDASVKKILSLKKDLGLFGEGVASNEQPTASDDTVGSREDQEVALQLAQESVVLLENKAEALPIVLDGGKDALTIFVTGPISNNKGYMCGGWSVFWSGSSNSSHFPNGVTLVEAIKEKADKRARVEHLDVVDADGKISSKEFDEALTIAKRSKYTIVALGEPNYAEKGGDIDDLALPTSQRAYLEALTKIPTTKVILVLLSGRQRTLHNAHNGAQAVLASFLPCEQGGQAIADVIFGDVNPSAKLPITYPKYSGNAMPYFHRVNTVCQHWKECTSQWPFGYGLSYTHFNYSDVVVIEPKQGEIHAKVTVTNDGARAGDEVVLLFLSQRARLASVPETKLLKRFKKVHLVPGQSEIVEFVLTMTDYGSYQPQIGKGFSRQAEAGVYTLSFSHSVNTAMDGTTPVTPLIVSDPASHFGNRGGGFDIEEHEPLVNEEKLKSLVRTFVVQA